MLIKKILITGSNGVLGTRLREVLNIHYPAIEFIQFKGNLCHPFEVDKNFFNIHYDAIIHLASIVATEEVHKNPALAYCVNVGGTANLLECIIRTYKAYGRTMPYFFLASSAHVYAPSDDYIHEDFELKPHNLYGQTKLLSEKVMQDIAVSEKIPFAIGRIFSFYDTLQKSPFLYPNIMKRLETHNSENVFELHGADSFRDISPAYAIAESIMKLVTKKFTGIINIGSGKPVKISDFVRSLTYKKLTIHAIGESNRLCADTTKLKQVLHD